MDLLILFSILVSIAAMTPLNPSEIAVRGGKEVQVALDLFPLGGIRRSASFVLLGFLPGDPGSLVSARRALVRQKLHLFVHTQL